MRAPRVCIARASTALAVSALLLLLAQQSFATPITQPTGLLPGQQYRLAFVTAGVRDATSSSLADYDAFVTAQANAVAELNSLGTTWQVIGSTETIDAFDHTGTNPTTSGIPIFLLNDTQLVDDYADLWDSSIDIPLNVAQNGTQVSATTVWTGTRQDGTSYNKYALGAFTGSSGRGDTTLMNSSWVCCGQVSQATERGLYGISAVLTVPAPEPALPALLALSAGALLLVRRTLAK